MHRISVRPSSPSTSGRHSSTKRRGQRVSVPGYDASPCAADSVASWRPRERSPRVQAKRAVEQKQRQEAAKRRGDQGKEQRGVTVDGGAGCRAGATGRATEQEQAGSLVFFFFSYLTSVTEETPERGYLIKKNK
jgi:hypothetical protein